MQKIFARARGDAFLNEHYFFTLHAKSTRMSSSSPSASAATMIVVEAGKG
jgi:hypothetical protein